MPLLVQVGCVLFWPDCLITPNDTKCYALLGDSIQNGDVLNMEGTNNPVKYVGEIWKLKEDWIAVNCEVVKI